MTKEEWKYKEKLIWIAIQQLNIKPDFILGYEEYYHYGLIGLVKGLKRSMYVDNEVSYLLTIIKHHIINGIHKENRIKRKPPKGMAKSLDDFKYDNEKRTYNETIENKNINVENEVLRKIMVEEIEKATDEVLTKKQRLYFCHYYGINGHEQKSKLQISKMYNVDHRSIYRRIEFATKKIKEYMKC